MNARSITIGLALVGVCLLGPPARAAETADARSDTTWFGRYTTVGGDFYAVPYASRSEAAWTFDRGIGPLGVPGRIDGAEGWAVVNLAIPPIPDYAGIADFACYGTSTECLTNNVLEVHADTCEQGYHPLGQYVRLESPICDLGPGWQGAFLEYSAYWNTTPGYIFWRPGWRYYPVPGPEGDQWSERVGSLTWFTAMGTNCLEGARAGASPYVPASATKVIAAIEIAAFDNPLGFPDFTTDFPGPLLDNLVVGAFGLTDLTGVVPGGPANSHGLVVSPNPSSTGTSLTFRMDRPANVRLEVMDVSGRVIRVLQDGPQPAGSRAVQWDGSDDLGRPVGAGVYWMRLRADGTVENRKAVIVR